MVVVKPVYLFIYRRDLRLDDNTALHACCTDAVKDDASVLLVFIFQSKQIDKTKNPYFSMNTVQFMIESLVDLYNVSDRRLNFYHSDKVGDDDVLTDLQKKYSFSRLYYNKDIVTPFARDRDARLDSWCFKHSVHVHSSFDYNLYGDLLQLKSYQVYGAFWKKYGGNAAVKSVKKPTSFNKKWTRVFLKDASAMSVEDLFKRYCPIRNDMLAVNGGRTGYVKDILERIKQKQFSTYNTNREFPFKDSTTKLSAYLKYGCISIREAYHAFLQAYGPDHGLIKELFWREFYDQVSVHFPRVLKGKSLREAYDTIPWQKNDKLFLAWCTGKTGFPIIDAAMNQLNKTGYMHNRMRMVVASFLVKDLLIDWRQGEKYFATKLVDYYPTANNGGWTFASGSGADAQQYNRIFNPWLQSAKYDKDAIYIKTWLPNLKEIPSKDLHSWNMTHVNYDMSKLNYYKPIVDHVQRAKIAKETYAIALAKARSLRP